MTICPDVHRSYLTVSQCLSASRSVNSDGADPKDDSHVGSVWDLSLHGSYLSQWYPAVGSHAASSHS